MIPENTGLITQEQAGKQTNKLCGRESEIEDLIRKTQKKCITFVECWTNIEDVGPTLYTCYTNVL